MIPSLEIKNFRTFDYLKIDKLAQVNLITGKNNVGKTSLLEAIALLKYEGRLNVIQEFGNIENRVINLLNTFFMVIFYQIYEECLKYQLVLI